jgi:hypothetical protein
MLMCCDIPFTRSLHTAADVSAYALIVQKLWCQIVVKVLLLPLLVVLLSVYYHSQ